MQWAGIQNPSVGMLWNADDPNSGRDVGVAKQWLAQHGQPKSDCGTAASQSFQMLNSKFAVCAYKVLQAYEQQVGPFTISSAYRSQDQQVCVCKPYGGPVAGKCGSAGATGADGYALSCQGHWHQCGLALDVNPSNGNYAQLHAFVQGKGLSFPIAGDAPHMMPASGDCSSGTNAGAVGSGLGNGAQTPTSGLTNLLRSYLGGNQQQPSSNPGGTIASTGSVPAGSGVSTNPGVSSSPGVSTSPGVSSTGGTYTSAVPANITNAYTPEPTNVSDSIGVPAASDSGTTSSFYLLQQLAGVTTTSVTIATGTPLALNSNLTQVGTTYDPQNNSATAVLQPGTLANSVSLSPAGNQQTFTSPDLQYSGGTYQPPQNTTMQQRVLENLKLALLKLLEVIRPFGYVRPEYEG